MRIGAGGQPNKSRSKPYKLEIMDKYIDIFKKLEDGLKQSLKAAGKDLGKEFERCKNLAYRRRPDADYFNMLKLIPFYSGFKAEIVDQKLDILHKYFPTYSEVAKITTAKQRRILSAAGMINNPQKVKAVVDNAKAFQLVIDQYKSFHNYLEGFRPTETLENLILLMEDLQCRFSYLGKTTVFHFMTEMGLPVLKPDRVIMRVFRRLGLVENERQFWRATMEGRKFAAANSISIRYVDIVIVKYGQKGRGAVCLQRPKCKICLLQEHCDYYRKRGVFGPPARGRQPARKKQES